MKTDLGRGRLALRLELLPITLGLALGASPELALAFLLAVAAHELGHYAAARALGSSTGSLLLQLTGGGRYLAGLESPGRRALVLVAGSGGGLILTLAALLLRPALGPGFGGRLASELVYAGVIWSAFQLSPLPPLDGGQLLRVLLARRLRATTLWRLSWAAGSLLGVLLVWLDSHLIQPVVLLGGVALVLGRAESGYVRHLDAYADWERGDHRAVVERVRRLPEYLERNDRVALLELGVHAAMELGSAEALGELATQLPAHRPVVMRAAEWLLGQDNALGAKLAQHALDALDAELVRPDADLAERFADLCLAYARAEARGRQVESALGLLERAAALGPLQRERLELDRDLGALRANPRFARLLARLGPGAES